MDDQHTLQPEEPFLPKGAQQVSSLEQCNCNKGGDHLLLFLTSTGIEYSNNRCNGFMVHGTST